MVHFYMLFPVTGKLCKAVDGQAESESVIFFLNYSWLDYFRQNSINNLKNTFGLYSSLTI